MPAARTIDEIWRLGELAGAALPPLTQETADRVAGILAAVRFPRAARAQEAA